jgi:hypothetical protein
VNRLDRVGAEAMDQLEARSAPNGRMITKCANGLSGRAAVIWSRSSDEQ